MRRFRAKRFAPSETNASAQKFLFENSSAFVGRWFDNTNRGARMKDLVSYEDFPTMGLKLRPHWIRMCVRMGEFPKPVKGAGIDGAKQCGRGSRFYWSKADVEKFIAARKP